MAALPAPVSEAQAQTHEVIRAGTLDDRIVCARVSYIISGVDVKRPPFIRDASRLSLFRASRPWKNQEVRWPIRVALLTLTLVGALAMPVAPQAQVEVVARGLRVPWALVFAPDGRAFVTERSGRVRVLTRGVLDAAPYFVVPGVAAEGEGGLLGLALHPDFPRQPFLYLYYTTKIGAQMYNRVIRLEDRAGRAGSWRVIVDRIPGFVYHDGGRIAFGPDGSLYIGTGYADTPALAHQLDSLAGKILRVNDDGSIPADNPFPGSPIYSYGHRNVQGLAWHPLTKRLYATEHGPTGEGGLCCRDELNLIVPGKDYGWPMVSGVVGDPRFVDPLLSSGPTEIWAPSGLTFATEEGTLRYSLFFAALRGRHLHRVVLDEEGMRVLADEKLLPWQFGRLRDVVQGPDGWLYVLTSNRDGRGVPTAGDDRVLRVRLSVPPY
jgi:glucose/arabinose dehydrogenase